MFPKKAPRALRGFEILQHLGVGGAGHVSLARSQRGKLVAIKMLGDDEPDDRVADFVREATLSARLHHPCIVQVRALLEEEGFAALVMEYVPGVALGRLLRFCTTRGVRLPDRSAWYIVERVLAALAYAHSLKDDAGNPTPIVHRDLSPANVLVDWTGGVKITDFGIAKMIGVSPATRVGVVKGTFGCMAPEQARGERVTERADVYAAALLGWRLATGRVPYAKHAEDEYELLRWMRAPKIKPLRSLRQDLPEAVTDAVARALEPDPRNRTITAEEFADAIRASLPISAGKAELEKLLRKWKDPLEKTVRPNPEMSAYLSRSVEGGTLRYEEVALAFDHDEDEVGPEPPAGPERAPMPSDAVIGEEREDDAPTLVRESAADIQAIRQQARAGLQMANALHGSGAPPKGEPQKSEIFFEADAGRRPVDDEPEEPTLSKESNLPTEVRNRPKPVSPWSREPPPSERKPSALATPDSAPSAFDRLSARAKGREADPGSSSVAPSRSRSAAVSEKPPSSFTPPDSRKASQDSPPSHVGKTGEPARRSSLLLDIVLFLLVAGISGVVTWWIRTRGLVWPTLPK